MANRKVGLWKYVRIDVHRARACAARQCDKLNDSSSGQSSNRTSEREVSNKMVNTTQLVCALSSWRFTAEFLPMTEENQAY
jgi:hypothetical protein